MNLCEAAWFNDTEFEPPETPHVHHCRMQTGHVDYHECGFTWNADDGTKLTCGIAW